MLFSGQPDQIFTQYGTFPYDYMTSHNVFKDTELDEADHEHAQIVWNALKMIGFSDCYNFYLKLDSFLLTVSQHMSADL